MSFFNELRKLIDDNSSPDKNAQSIEALKHSKSYSKLLDIYVSSTKCNIILKIILKILFFVITMGSLVAVVLIFYWTLRYAFKTIESFKNLNDISFEAILSIATVIFPAIASLIVAFLKIPQIIAEYLFNIKEDTFMNSVIKNIQEYDKVMFAMEHKIDELLLQNKKESEETIDEEIEDSPKEVAQ